MAPKVIKYKTLNGLVSKLRSEFDNTDFIMLYAHNGSGKTRSSMEFKDKGKRINNGVEKTVKLTTQIRSKLTTSFGAN